MGTTHEDALQAALDKFNLTLTLKEKQKEALDHILDHCFDKICDCFTTNWLWKKSGVFLITPCSEKEEGPRQDVYWWYVLSTWSNQTSSEVSLNMMYQLAVSPKIVELIQLVVYNTQLKMWSLGNSISSSPTLRLCSTQRRKGRCCLTKAFKSW